MVAVWSLSHFFGPPRRFPRSRSFVLSHLTTTTEELAGDVSNLKIENEFLKVTLSPQTGLPDKLFNKVTGQEIALHQKVCCQLHTCVRCVVCVRFCRGGVLLLTVLRPCSTPSIKPREAEPTSSVPLV